MIPKIIHYCWFGRNPKPELAHKCIKSWKKYCKEYQIIEWNEDNFDISVCPLYVRQAYEAKKWAFVTDYVRLKVVYDHGGIYLDTDVELIKSLNGLLGNGAFFGFENSEYVATGLGFGAVKGHAILYEMMADYESIAFIKEDGTFDLKPCPKRNTRVLIDRGLTQDNSRQILDGDVLILPSSVLCPVDYETGKRKIKRETVSIHWFSASWITEKEKKAHDEWIKKKKAIERMARIDCLIHLPNRILMAVLGTDKYAKLKKYLKGE